MLLAGFGLQRDAVLVDAGDAHFGAGPHTQIDEVLLGFARKIRRIRRQHAIGSVQKQDASFLGADGAELVFQRVASDLAQRARELDARGAGAYNHECQPCAAEDRIALPLGSLEREQDLVADARRVFDRFQTRGYMLPLIVPK